DVAAAAANDYLYYAGASRAGQGTSFATPLWAGLVAEMDAQHGASLGFVNGNLYAIGAAEPTGNLPVGLVDVTAGGNCLGPAGPGWDTASGWGSPRAVALYADLTASIVNVTIDTVPDPSPPGGSVTVSARVTNQSSGVPEAGVAVRLSLTADTAIGVCQGSFGTASSVTNATGVASTSFSIPGCYLGTKAVASALVSGNGLYGSASALVPVNLLGYLPFLGPLARPPYDVLLYAAILGSAMVVGWAIGRPARRRRAGSASRAASVPVPPAGATDPPRTARPPEPPPSSPGPPPPESPAAARSSTPSRAPPESGEPTPSETPPNR
ncbi:membrane protein, partial [mine drainage metagenome]